MGICSSAKKWDECREDSGLAELADSKITSYGMKCVSCLLQGREEIQGGRRGTESGGALTGVDQGTKQLLPLTGTFAGLAFTPRTATFPLNSSLISPQSCMLAGAWEPFLLLGRRLAVTAELRHKHREQD